MTHHSLPITISVPGTCGELVQGWYAPWDEAVLVSCPVACYNRVTVELCPTSHIDAPHTHPKAWQAARLLLDTLDRPNFGAKVSIHSQLPVGRGMASSTADIVGVMVALCVALKQQPNPAQLVKLACRIEPSDSIMFAATTMLAYRGSGRFHILGSVPPLACLILDPGQTIDTVTYNARLNLSRVRQLASTTQTAINLLLQGLTTNDPTAIGAASTLSATAYQAINYSSLVTRARQWTKTTGALGIVRAHSGSVVGLLYPPGTPLEDAASWLSSQFKGRIIQTHLTNTGYKIESLSLENAI